ncbi:MAG: hypothetical protein Ct9H300mP6_15800 [Gammaproteobacteria bacterium]|nr:MAG: hypothetical protein Ct9H300mP6_15800 [Gammaproteobacteria bacterium]
MVKKEELADHFYCKLPSPLILQGQKNEQFVVLVYNLLLLSILLWLLSPFSMVLVATVVPCITEVIFDGSTLAFLKNFINPIKYTYR